MSISALKEKFNSLTLESENHWDYRGNNNSERDYVHGFCTYPAMMVPKMQREMLDVCLEHLQDTSIRLLDPFAGSGTILVEGMLRGLNIVGIDINPLAILLCKAKTTILNPTTLHEKTVQLFAWITIHDKTPLYKFDGINKWFTNQAISDLSRIRAGIIAEETIEYRRFFWASFCEVVRIVSNSRDCTYKLHIKEKKDIDAYSLDALRKQMSYFNPGLKFVRAEKQIFSFKEFIKTHKSFYIERCKNKNIEFYVDVSRDFDLRLNRGMLNQVFDNLFSNAEYWLDYSAQQGLIENKQYHISAIERGIIVVWDNGIGISPDLETRLFDPFETKKKDGRGLGLYIAAGNLKYSSSRIRLLNERNRFGNLFKFEIDVSQAMQ